MIQRCTVGLTERHVLSIWEREREWHQSDQNVEPPRPPTGYRRTWRQDVSHAEQRWRFDDVDGAAGVAAQALHGGRQVAELHLQLKQQRGVHVEQRVDLGVSRLQRAQPLVKRRVQASALLTLAGEGRRD